MSTAEKGNLFIIGDQFILGNNKGRISLNYPIKKCYHFESISDLLIFDTIKSISKSNDHNNKK